MRLVGAGAGCQVRKDRTAEKNSNLLSAQKKKKGRGLPHEHEKILCCGEGNPAFSPREKKEKVASKEGRRGGSTSPPPKKKRARALPKSKKVGHQHPESRAKREPISQKRARKASLSRGSFARGFFAKTRKVSPREKAEREGYLLGGRDGLSCRGKTAMYRAKKKEEEDIKGPSGEWECFEVEIVAARREKNQLKRGESPFRGECKFARKGGYPDPANVRKERSAEMCEKARPLSSQKRVWARCT